MWDGFIEAFANENWWTIVNSSIVATVLSSAVGIFVATRVGQVAAESRAVTKAKRDTERAKSRAEDEAPVEEAAAAAAPPSPEQAEERARFHRAASGIRALKDYVDARADRVQDGRVGRKYDNISRHDYRVMIATLGSDGGLSDLELKELTNLFERWQPFRTGRQLVSESVASEYAALAKANKYRVTPTNPKSWWPRTGSG